MTTLMNRKTEPDFFSELPSLFNDPFMRDWFSWPKAISDGNKNSSPAVNIRETESDYEITVAAPGMNKGDFKIELDQNRLVISGEKQGKKEQKNNEGFIRKEFNYQSFVRSFTLAEQQVQGDKIEARYADGILHITIPKSADSKSKAPRTIPIS